MFLVWLSVKVTFFFCAISKNILLHEISYVLYFNVYLLPMVSLHYGGAALILQSTDVFCLAVVQHFSKTLRRFLKCKFTMNLH